MIPTLPLARTSVTWRQINWAVVVWNHWLSRLSTIDSSKGLTVGLPTLSLCMSLLWGIISRSHHKGGRTCISFYIYVQQTKIRTLTLFHVVSRAKEVRVDSVLPFFLFYFSALLAQRVAFNMEPLLGSLWNQFIDLNGSKVYFIVKLYTKTYFQLGGQIQRSRASSGVVKPFASAGPTAIFDPFSGLFAYLGRVTVP